MEERELITLALGNYSTLVAAQWCNSSSYYDVHHHTLYREYRGDDLLCGNVTDDGGGTTMTSGGRKVRRVPRVLLLDAPHASTLTDLRHVQEEMQQAKGHTAADEEEEEVPPSLLFKSPAVGAELTREEKDLNKLLHFVEKKWSDRFSHPQQEGVEEAENEEEEDDEEEEDEQDFWYTNKNSEDREDEGGEKGEGGASSADAKKKKKKKKAASHLFRQKDQLIPWWRYITTGLHPDSLVTLRPLPASEGEVPAFHSYSGGGAAVVAGEEMRTYGDALRRQLEDADRLQGLQCYVDADSLFGSLAQHVIEDTLDEAGSKTSVAVWSLFSPLPAAFWQTSAAAHINFADRRRDETVLNRLLATVQLSAPSSVVYTPVEIKDWPAFFQVPVGDPRGAWLEHDPSTAQYIAAVTDTALYGLRDRSCTSDATAAPAYYMPQWCRTIRPSPSLRVAALMGALPLSLQAPPAAVPHKRTRADGAEEHGETDLWDLLTALPLLPDAQRATAAAARQDHRPCAAAAPTTARPFVSLTHAMRRPLDSEAGRVVGHAVSLRGPGVLSSHTYHAQEALLRYALPLRTNLYLPLLTSNPYPVSQTFPSELLAWGAEGAEEQQAKERTQARRAEREGSDDASVNVAAHVLSTYSSYDMLAQLAAAAKPLVQRSTHRYSANYHMETEEWAERLEQLQEIVDDYRHEDYLEEDNEEGDW